MIMFIETWTLALDISWAAPENLFLKCKDEKLNQNKKKKTMHNWQVNCFEYMKSRTIRFTKWNEF